jgi:DNA adenine methylase
MHGELTNFWNVLKSETDFARMQRILQATPFSEVEFDLVKQGVETTDPVERAVNFFVLCRQSHSGKMTGFAAISRTRVRRNMNEQASAWITALEGLPAVHARLRRVVILNRKATDVIKGQDGEKTLFYLDPPYMHETRTTTIEYGDHEMSVDDHKEMLDVLSRCKGRFLLSMYRHPLYDQAAKTYGWNRLDFDLPNNAAAGAEKRRMTECVWMNFKP